LKHKPTKTAELGIVEEEALKKGMEEKSREFAEKGNEIYAKACRVARASRLCIEAARLNHRLTN